MSLTVLRVHAQSICEDLLCIPVLGMYWTMVDARFGNYSHTGTLSAKTSVFDDV
jgi:hypothetical protein